MLPSEHIEPVTQVLYKKHKHASHITLWDKLKMAAHRDRDGKLYCIVCLAIVYINDDVIDNREDGVRGQLDASLNLKEEGSNEEDGRRASEGEEKRPGILRSPTDTNDRVSIDSSTKTTSHNKKVLFNISSNTSISSSQPPTTVNGGEAIEMSPIREVDEKECK